MGLHSTTGEAEKPTGVGQKKLRTGELKEEGRRGELDVEYGQCLSMKIACGQRGDQILDLRVISTMLSPTELSGPQPARRGEYHHTHTGPTLCQTPIHPVAHRVRYHWRFAPPRRCYCHWHSHLPYEDRQACWLGDAGVVDRREES
nr:hypothetical transcript [Hymenolepis microstoma]